MHYHDMNEPRWGKEERAYAAPEDMRSPEAPRHPRRRGEDDFREERRGRRCPDCPHEEPRCSECERRGGMGREERRPEDRRREEHDRPESRVPGTALGKLALCGRLAEQHRGRRRGQMHILRILEENGSMSQRVLQELLQIQPGSMSEIAAKLEVGGLIRRERSEEDKRRVTVSITEKGKETLAALPQGAPDTLEPLTEEEQKLLTELLDKLIDAWGAERRGPRRGGFGPDRGPRGPRPPMRRGPERL